MGRGPRFFCDHCGAEVPRNARRCPSCNRIFSSVLCPKCGFSGAERLFAAGCPVCGYSAIPQNDELRVSSGDRVPLQSAGPLPLWVYALTALALLAVAAAAFALLR